MSDQSETNRSYHQAPEMQQNAPSPRPGSGHPEYPQPTYLAQGLAAIHVPGMFIPSSAATATVERNEVMPPMASNSIIESSYRPGMGAYVAGQYQSRFVPPMMNGGCVPHAPAPPASMPHPQGYGAMIQPHSYGPMIHPQAYGPMSHPQCYGPIVNPQIYGPMAHPQTSYAPPPMSRPPNCGPMMGFGCVGRFNTPLVAGFRGAIHTIPTGTDLHASPYGCDANTNPQRRTSSPRPTGTTAPARVPRQECATVAKSQQTLIYHGQRIAPVLNAPPPPGMGTANNQNRTNNNNFSGDFSLSDISSIPFDTLEQIPTIQPLITQQTNANGETRVFVHRPPPGFAPLPNPNLEPSNNQQANGRRVLSGSELDIRQIRSEYEALCREYGIPGFDEQQSEESQGLLTDPRVPRNLEEGQGDASSGDGYDALLQAIRNAERYILCMKYGLPYVP